MSPKGVRIKDEFSGMKDKRVAWRMRMLKANKCPACGKAKPEHYSLRFCVVCNEKHKVRTYAYNKRVKG
jgi:ribosomal protein L32